jgi:hypothetical protein
MSTQSRDSSEYSIVIVITLGVGDWTRPMNSVVSVKVLVDDRNRSCGQVIDTTTTNKVVITGTGGGGGHTERSIEVDAVTVTVAFEFKPPLYVIVAPVSAVVR